MRKILMISVLSCIAAVAWSSDFGRWFSNNTLRVDVSVIGGGPDEGVRIDSIVRWPGWYGRRANMARAQYPDEMMITLIDAATNDTIYCDTKCLTFPDDPGLPDGHGPRREPPRPSTAVMFAPMPVAPAYLEVTSYGPGEHGLEKWESARQYLSEEFLSQPMPLQRPTLPYSTLRTPADPERCINLAFISEGYTQAEIGKFMRDAVQLDSALFAQPAFKEYADRFNVVAVMLPSEESGITEPRKGKIVNSALHSHFDSFGLDRLITMPSPAAMWDVLEGIPASYVMVLCNTERYGGSGPVNDYAIGSAGHPQFTEIIIHEFGHSFGNLGDEYEAGYDIQYGPEAEPSEPNITTLTDFSGKWQNLIDSGEAGLIEGAGYQSKGVWRGCKNCLMRTIEEHYFCPVCRQALGRSIRYRTY